MTNQPTRSLASLTALADEALAAKATGDSHAEFALHGEELGSQKIAALEQAAAAGNEEAQQMLEWLRESKEATFTDAFARASYFRGCIATLAAAPNPDPDRVLATFFSGQGTKMRVRGNSQLQPAIPLFRSFQKRHDAVKFHPSPMIIPSSHRSKERGSEQMESRETVYMVPATALDRQCFEQLQTLFRRMPEGLIAWIEAQAKLDLRQTVWLALHFMPGSFVLTPKWVDRMFYEKAGVIRMRDSNAIYLRFRLSLGSEHYMVLNTSDSDRLIQLLEAAKTA